MSEKKQFQIGSIVNTTIYGQGRIVAIPDIPGSVGRRYQMITTGGRSVIVHESSVIQEVSPGSVVRDEQYGKNLEIEFGEFFSDNLKTSGEQHSVIDLGSEISELLDGIEFEGFPNDLNAQPVPFNLGKAA